jgi:outer membrane receptor for ferrienterochelin and colicin
MRKIVLIFGIILTFQTYGLAQTVSGKVFEKSDRGKKVPLVGVNVYWAHSLDGTTSDIQGRFEINTKTGHDDEAEEANEDPGHDAGHDGHDEHLLVFSFIGYQKDTIHVHENMHNVEVILSSSVVLEGVEVSARQAGTSLSRIDPILTQNISGAELCKAACCNLSESFETNASVDVNYSDAVTGAKHIQLLGLAGIYSQIMTENIPNYYGLANSFGLMYVPGPWMESIQVSKGAAAVVNGYESISGQINVEYKKPDNSEKIYLNAFADAYGRIEGNFNSAVKLNDRWSTGLFGHASNNQQKEDHNGDGFLDHPLYTQYNVLNRWKYESEKFITQFGFQYINEDRIGGQTDFNKSDEPIITNPYGISILTNRAQAFWKSGIIFNRDMTSLGFLTSYTWHQQESMFGLRDYDATENSYYGNLIFQSYIGDTRHAYSTGISYRFDNYDENLSDSAYSIRESVPGIFFQYTFTNPEKFTFIAGMRADIHNVYGTFYTPRVHAKYNITPNTILRASAGKGYRTANVIADNISLLASSRQIIAEENLEQENAWNYGLSLTQYFDLLGRQLTLSADFYRTDFISQVVVDVDADAQQVRIYNLDGTSYSNSFQVGLNYELVRNLDLVAAFRINDVQMTTDNELQRKPLVSKYKGLVNLSYATNLNKWQFDFTTQFNGGGRLPNTLSNPTEPVNYQRGETFPAYTIINTQVTKYFRKWSIYVGGENLLGFTQDNPILAADNPFGEYFDASMVWGPIMGRKLYIGLRFAIE